MTVSCSGIGCNDLIWGGESLGGKRIVGNKERAVGVALRAHDLRRNDEQDHTQIPHEETVVLHDTPPSAEANALRLARSIDGSEEFRPCCRTHGLWGR